jgi:hypothetical protein
MTAKREAVAGVVFEPNAKDSGDSEVVPVKVPVTEPVAVIQ